MRESLRKTQTLFTRELDIRERHSWGSATVTLNDPQVGKRDGVRVNAVLIRVAKTSSCPVRLGDIADRLVSRLGCRLAFCCSQPNNDKDNAAGERLNRAK